jgi:hypothetical protein
MKKTISILLILVMVLLLAACSKPAEEKIDYTGTYDVVLIEAGDQSVSAEELQNLRELGYEAIMSFADDGTGLMSIGGEENDFTYDAEAGTITMNGLESKMEFNEAGQLVILEDGASMTLEKRAEE